jgi:predicted patatin/cPLA2 family phospholipase
LNNFYFVRYLIEKKSHFDKNVAWKINKKCYFDIKDFLKNKSQIFKVWSCDLIRDMNFRFYRDSYPQPKEEEAYIIHNREKEQPMNEATTKKWINRDNTKQRIFLILVRIKRRNKSTRNSNKRNKTKLNKS